MGRNISGPSISSFELPRTVISVSGVLLSSSPNFLSQQWEDSDVFPFPPLLSNIPGMKLTEIKPTAVMHACCWSSQVQDFLVHWNPIRSTKRRREGTRTDNECVTRCELSFSWVFSLSSLRIRGREGALDWRMACGTQPCPFTALKCSVFRHSLSISLFYFWGDAGLNHL